MENPIITLTTDWGTRDYFVAALKGMIYKKIPRAVITDITNELGVADMLRCSYILRNAYVHFPAGTIHLIGMDAERYKGEDIESDLPRRYLAVEYHGHFFIAADSGIFSLIFDVAPVNIVEIAHFDNMERTSMFELYVDVCAKLTAGEDFFSLGTPVEQTMQLYAFQSYLAEDAMVGKIIFVDRNGNLVTNINFRLFESLANNRPFDIYLRPDVTLHTLSGWYDDVPKGELLIMVNHAGFLEIAINGNSAHKMFGIKEGDQLRINFRHDNKTGKTHLKTGAGE